MSLQIFKKGIADGHCGVCNKIVPDKFPNKFYCSYDCCSRAFNYFHPPKQLEENNEGYIDDDENFNVYTY